MGLQQIELAPVDGGLLGRSMSAQPFDDIRRAAGERSHERAQLSHRRIDHGRPGLQRAGMPLERNPEPTEEDIRTGLAGNLCRCTGYMKIFESVVRACQK